MTGDLDLVKAELINRMRDVCEKLLPDGRLESGQWVSFNPVEGDFKPGRLPALKVRLHGGVVGAWRDYRSGDKGDALGLVAYVMFGDTREAKKALAWSREFLGLRAMSSQERAQLRKAAAQRSNDREKDNARSRAYRLKMAGELFHKNTSRFGAMSPAELHARAYFAERGVGLDGIANLNPETFRFAPATEWWKGATWANEDGRRYKTAEGPRFPAVHAAMRQWNGEISCCHVTFLDPVRPKKAPVEPAKLMIGEALGAVIEISTGPSGIPFWLATEPGPLIIGEGIETALSFALTVPEARVWAGGSLAGVGSAPAQLPCVEWVLFARDNNDGNPQAQKQFDQALAGLEKHGKRVVVEASHVGDDFNDLAQGQE